MNEKQDYEKDIVDNNDGGGGGGGFGSGVFEPAHHLCAAGNDEFGDAADKRGSGEFDQRGDAAPLGCTNYLTLGASSDGLVFTPTNTPFLTLTVVVPATSTNGVLVTNLSWSFLGSIGYLQLQTMGCQGTNTTTNHSVLIWRKPKRNG